MGENILILAAVVSMLSGLAGAGFATGIFKKTVNVVEDEIQKLKKRVDNHDVDGFVWSQSQQDTICENKRRIENLMEKLEPLTKDVSAMRVHIEWLVKEYKNGGKYSK